MVLISIEGNIGSGKSTVINKLAHYFKHNPNVYCITENIKLWDVISKEDNFIEKFYADQKKYAYLFQITVIEAMRTEIAEIKNNNKNAIIIMERSITSSSKVFCKMMYDDGYITDDEKEKYLELIDDSNYFMPDHMIYLNVSAKTSLKRIKERARDGEDRIDIEYLKKIESYHVKMFDEIKNKIIITENKSLKNDMFNKCKKQIKNIIPNLYF